MPTTIEVPYDQEPDLQRQVHAGEGGEAHHVGQAVGDVGGMYGSRAETDVPTFSAEVSSTRMKGRPRWGNQACTGVPASPSPYAVVLWAMGA